MIFLGLRPSRAYCKIVLTLRLWVLSILTCKQVLCTPFADQNYLFGLIFCAFSSFSHLGRKKMEKLDEMQKKMMKHLFAGQNTQHVSVNCIVVMKKTVFKEVFNYYFHHNKTYVVQMRLKAVYAVTSLKKCFSHQAQNCMKKIVFVVVVYVCSYLYVCCPRQKIWVRVN